MLVVGLTCLNVWPDLVGHGTAFLGAATLVQHITNGRVFFSLGLGCAAGTYALVPRWLATHDDSALGATTVVAVAATVGYAAGTSLGWPPAAEAALAYAIGCGYGTLLVRFMCQLAQSGGMRTILIASATSLILKTALDMVFGLFGTDAQITVTVAMPLVCAAVLFAAPRLPAHGDSPVDLTELPRCNPTNERVLMAMLLMIAVLHAITRSMSTLGFWGGGYTVAGGIKAGDLFAFALFAVAAYLTMAQDTNPDMLTRFLVPILGLMAGFLLLDKNLSALIGLSDEARSIAGTTVELYAHTLYWIIHVTAIRYLATHPYRLTGIAAALMSIVAVFMALLFQQTSDITKAPLQMDSTVVMVAIYAFAVFIAVLLRGMQGSSPAAGPAELQAEERLRRLAEEHGLSPRETDVFLLLARGRDRSFIRGELFISDATVKTHIQRIYAKFGVHSKQELISVVEEAASAA